MLRACIVWCFRWVYSAVRNIKILVENGRSLTDNLRTQTTLFYVEEIMIFFSSIREAAVCARGPPWPQWLTRIRKELDVHRAKYWISKKNYCSNSFLLIFVVSYQTMYQNVICTYITAELFIILLFIRFCSYMQLVSEHCMFRRT